MIQLEEIRFRLFWLLVVLLIGSSASTNPALLYDFLAFDNDITIQAVLFHEGSIDQDCSLCNELLYHHIPQLASTPFNVFGNDTELSSMLNDHSLVVINSQTDLKALFINRTRPELTHNTFLIINEGFEAVHESKAVEKALDMTLSAGVDVFYNSQLYFVISHHVIEVFSAFFPPNGCLLFWKITQRNHETFRCKVKPVIKVCYFGHW